MHSEHPWYFYFDNKPQDEVQEKRITGQDTTVKYIPKKRADTTKKPHFPIQGEICEDLINWLCAACGGVMKFLKYCCEDDDDELSEDFVDYCLRSRNLITKFIEHIGNYFGSK